VTTEELNALDAEVAKLMGIEVIHKDGQGRLVFAHDEVLYWQPTRDPRCERIVVEWAVVRGCEVRQIADPLFLYSCIVRRKVDSRNCITYTTRVGKSDTSLGIALCLAVVEAFGGGRKA
jgi:hypothetical protein